MCVSVIMAVHDDAGGVSRAIESIVRQTNPDWELIVVDDGSTDDTLAVLQRWAATDARIRVMSNSTNCGLASALNRAWRASSCQLIARMDADDVSLPERLERQTAFLRAHPNVDVVGSGVELLDERGAALGQAFRPAGHDALTSKIYRENPFIHPTVMMRRRVLEETGGYDEGLRRAQDFDLWLRTYQRFRFGNVQEPLLRYRVRRRPLFSALVWGAYVLARGAMREGQPFGKGLYAVRFFAAGLLAKAGIWRSGLR
jgi:glycosyltransferase involved in cell wall biosynthesis